MAAMVAEEPARDDMGALGMLERLGNELSLRRGMHVSLAPDKADIPVLEVVSDLPGPARQRHGSPLVPCASRHPQRGQPPRSLPFHSRF